MMTVRIKKLFKGYLASIRDYIVMECISKGLTLRIIYEDGYMDLAPEMLRKGLQFTEGSLKSKFTNRKYQLIDFYWIPNFHRQSMTAPSSHSERNSLTRT
jgi:hypothetical protein